MTTPPSAPPTPWDPGLLEGVPILRWDWATVNGEESANGTTWGYFHVVGTYDGTTFTVTEPAGPPIDEPEDPDRSFEPACDDPDVVDPSQGGAEWEAMSQDLGAFDTDLVAAWVSDPAGDWDGPFVGNVVVLPGAAEVAMATIREHYAGAVCVVERDGSTEAELERVQGELFNEDAIAVLGQVQGASGDNQRGVVVAEVWRVDDDALAFVEARWGGLVELTGILQPVG